MKVSVVIVNWNGKEFLDECLNSIYKQSFKDFEVIFVDNNSSDGSLDLVSKNFPKAVLVKSRKNSGFAQGNNLGIREAKGEYIATLNTDMKAHRDWLKNLVETAESRDDVGVVGSKIVLQHASKSGIIDTVGTRFTKFGFFSDIKRVSQLSRLFGVCAGAALWRRKMLDDITVCGEPFDKDFFLYSEDTDLCFRARLRNWKILTCLGSIAYHRHSGSTSKIPGINNYYGNRNNLLVLVKDLPFSLWIRYCVPILIGQLASIIYHTIKGRAFMVIRSKSAALLLIPKMLSKRRAIQQGKLSRNKEISDLMSNSFV